ncbi:hypothetical protein KY285_023937 [Solanum tuberosum]|nr:hypothetical protein KY289_024277 [Solanum tuberosum]KAH0676136.1 hypothetical protein KY285_023937 [Solanum tuberosum]
MQVQTEGTITSSWNGIGRKEVRILGFHGCFCFPTAHLILIQWSRFNSILSYFLNYQNLTLKIFNSFSSSPSFRLLPSSSPASSSNTQASEPELWPAAPGELEQHPASSSSNQTTPPANLHRWQQLQTASTAAPARAPQRATLPASSSESWRHPGPAAATTNCSNQRDPRVSIPLISSESMEHLDKDRSLQICPGF